MTKRTAIILIAILIMTMLSGCMAMIPEEYRGQVEKLGEQVKEQVDKVSKELMSKTSLTATEKAQVEKFLDDNCEVALGEKKASELPDIAKAFMWGVVGNYVEKGIISEIPPGYMKTINSFIDGCLSGINIDKIVEDIKDITSDSMKKVIEGDVDGVREELEDYAKRTSEANKK